jgi:ribosome biogenesis GTPase
MTPAQRSDSAEGRRGRIVAHYGVAVAVRLEPDGGATPEGEEVPAGEEVRRVPVRRRASHVVGERVVLEGERLRSLPATGVLRRRDSHGRVRAIAAELDVLGIVLAPIPVSPMGFVDRAIVAARTAGLAPFIVLNKCDLPGVDSLIDALPRCYAELMPLHRVSATLGTGLEALRAQLAPDHRGAFVGTSGVGKSSLLNALRPDLDLAVGEINEASGLGRHVTSNATLHRIGGGGELVDTPGFRDFGPVEVSTRELAQHFPGFERALESGCRFRDCLHRG